MSTRISLFGRPQIIIDNRPHETLLGHSRLSALLFYLALNKQTSSRRALAFLLWPDIDESKALGNLRVEIHRLVQKFKIDHLLAYSKKACSFNFDTKPWLDVAVFKAALDDPQASHAQLVEAATLYVGELLEDFNVPDAPNFDEWLRIEREKYHKDYQQLLLRLTRLCLAEGRYPDGIQWGQRLLDADPYQEELYLLLMEMLARTGQRTKALDLYQVCDARLNRELGIDLSPAIHDLAEAIESGVVGPTAITHERSPDWSPAVDLPPPFQAPAPPFHFAGRDVEVNQIVAQLSELEPSSTTARAVALVGMGGVGKSTMAAMVAHRLRETFVDGVLWAYVGNSDPLDILGSWAQAMGYDFSAITDVDNRAAALRNLLNEKRMLLVLDDVRSAARARPLLAHSPTCATLITSRDRDTASVLQAQITPLHSLTSQGSLALMSHILGMERVDNERKAAEEICGLLAHLPLAIEITAQRLLARPHRLSRQATQLRKVQNRLNLAVSDLAVRTSFTVSWESLDRAHQRIFALLGLFQGRNFTAAALASIAQIDDIYVAEDHLFNLAALSLLTIEGDRYRQHSLLSDFAAEKLSEGYGSLDNGAPDEIGQDAIYAAVLGRFAAAYLGFLAENQTNAAALHEEWGNILAGMEMAYAHKQWHLVLSYAQGLDEIWLNEGRYPEAQVGYQQASEAAEQLGDVAALAHFLCKQAVASLEQADDEVAAALLERSLTLCQEVGNQVEEAEVLFCLGRLAIEQKRFDQGQGWLERCRQIRTTLGDQAGIARTLYLEADIPYYQEAYEEAKRLGEQALTIQLDVQDQLGAIQSLGLLADCAIKQSAYAVAERHCQDALTFCDAIGDQIERSVILYIYGEVKRLLGAFEEAELYLKESLALFSFMGDRRMEARTLLRLGNVYINNNEIGEAQQVVGQSSKINLALNNNWDQAFDFDLEARIYLAINNQALAESKWQEALALISQFEVHPLRDIINMHLNKNS